MGRASRGSGSRGEGGRHTSSKGHGEGGGLRDEGAQQGEGHRLRRDGGLRADHAPYKGRTPSKGHLAKGTVHQAMQCYVKVACRTSGLATGGEAH